MKIHACFLDKECRSVGASGRLYVFTKHFGNLTVGARSVAWLPFLGYMPWDRWYWWWFITWEPPRHRRKRGWMARRYPERYGLKKESDT